LSVASALYWISNRPNGAGSPPVAAGLAAEAVTGDRGDHAGERADQDASKLAQHQDLDEMTRASASQDRPDSFGPKGPSPTAPVSVGLMLHEVTGPEFEAMLDLLESDQHRPRLAF